MIVISDNGSLIDENKIISIIQTGIADMEIVLDNGRQFYKLNMCYPDEKTKRKYLNKIKTALEVKNSLLKYEEMQRIDSDRDTVSIYVDGKIRYDEVLDGEIVILKRRNIY